MARTRRRTGTKRRSTALAPTKPLKLDLLPAERIAFMHPSWARWWAFPNAEANPELAKLITGLFMVFVESESGNDSVKHYDEMKERCEALGWTFIPGLRFSHRSRADWGRLMKIREHEKIIGQAKDWPSLMLDMESYGIKAGQRYHSGADAYALHEAAEPWNRFTKPLYVYPPTFKAPASILRRYGLSEWGVALDHTTYQASRFGSVKDLKKAMHLRNSYSLHHNTLYCPGFYLRYLKDRKVMAAAAGYGRCWLFPSPKGDDRRNLFTPDWSPDAT